MPSVDKETEKTKTEKKESLKTISSSKNSEKPYDNLGKDKKEAVVKDEKVTSSRSDSVKSSKLTSDKKAAEMSSK